MTRNHKVDNAIIMAAGRSVRFAPISYEYPKPLLEVKGEILIERQIKQLKEAGIEDIIIVVGYKKELFTYLVDKFGVSIVENPEYNTRNNNSTLYYVRERLGNTYICSADNYFKENIFESHVDRSYYSSIYEEGRTNEWCLTTDEEGLITNVKVGGEDSWVMMGHVYFSRDFSEKFVAILEAIYDEEETAPMLWESIYLKNIEDLDLHIRKYSNEIIFEFDTLDELREFDKSYINNTRSDILKSIARSLDIEEKDIVNSKPILESGNPLGFEFFVDGKKYKYDYETERLSKY